MKTPVVVPALLGALLSFASPALAQSVETGWYVGLGAGQLNTDFSPYYTYYGGGTPDQFENDAEGLHVEVLAGKRHRLSDRFSLSMEGSASFNSFKWSLEIPDEPSELQYSLPYRLALSVVPEVHFGRVSVFAGLGGGIGRVHQMKTTPDSQVSRYDYDRVKPTLNIGGGVKVKAGGFDVFAHISRARYFGVEYDTFRPQIGAIFSAVRVEHVTDKPRATGFTVGVIKRF